MPNIVYGFRVPLSVFNFQAQIVLIGTVALGQSYSMIKVAGLSSRSQSGVKVEGRLILGSRSARCGLICGGNF